MEQWVGKPRIDHGPGGPCAARTEEPAHAHRPQIRVAMSRDPFLAAALTAAARGWAVLPLVAEEMNPVIRDNW
jgi:hypothetical protein